MKTLMVICMLLMNAIPAAHAQGWMTYDDYPKQALKERREGISHLRASIGADGLVKDCQITQSSGSADLDEAACDIFRRRARFNPARDSNGNPMEDSYETRFVWKISR